MQKKRNLKKNEKNERKAKKIQFFFYIKSKDDIIEKWSKWKNVAMCISYRNKMVM